MILSSDEAPLLAPGVVVTEAQKTDAPKTDAPGNLVNRAIQLPDLTKRENVSAAVIRGVFSSAYGQLAV